MLPFLLAASLSYLLGSIPSGYLAGRIAGVDIRHRGSGNIGATNVTRELGKAYGYPVFFADFGKGLASVGLAKLLAHRLSPAESHQAIQIIAGVFSVLGNTFPVWLKFRGGKGVATSAGVLFGLAPVAVLIAIVVWILTFEAVRYVSLASIAAALTLPASVFVITKMTPPHDLLLFYFSVCLAALVVLRHRSNLVRLIRGTEQRFERR